MAFATGVSRLCAQPSLLGQRCGAWGLLTNYTGTMPDLTRNVDAVIAAGIPIATLLSPEHGLWGSAQAGDSEPATVDEYTGLRVVDTYHAAGPALDDLLRGCGIDGILVDLQDIGVRYYTYIWSLFDVMLAAARIGLPVSMLDRPNPLALFGTRGPGVSPECTSFVGRASIPLLHGLTIGELALRFNAIEVPRQAGRPVPLAVIEMAGWDRSGIDQAPTVPWVPPSPNIPTFSAALAYAGTCLFEGTNVSEGRGTTHPFESIGAGFVDARLVAELRDLALPGVLFREQFFVPSFSKWAGERVRGVQLHITEPRDFDPLATGVAVLQTIHRLYPGDFRFLEPEQHGQPPFIDLLWGSDVLRRRVDSPLDDILRDSPEPARPRPETLLYP